MPMTRWAICAGLLAAAGPAAAHVTLSQPQAPAGSPYVAYFRVGHGCDGAATTALRIEIPAEVSNVRPQPKPGWTLRIDRAPAAEGREGKERVTAITWSGGPLPDDEWDEFGISAKLPAHEGPLYFPAIQTCGSVQVRWSDRPSSGGAGGRPEHPAPTVLITPAGRSATTMNMPMGR